MMKAGLIDTLPENPKAAFVQAMMDSELASILGDEEDPRNMGEVTYNVDDPKDIPDNLEPEDQINIQKENKMKKSDLLKDYMSSRKETNLNEQMKTHQKEAKRSILMESVAGKMNDLFEMGRTNEEIVLDYANKGVQVPESLVEKFRKQYAKMKEMKLQI